jgi:hypothetical protein
LQQVLDLFLWRNATLPVMELAASFEQACIKETGQFDSSHMCSSIASAIRADPSTNLGRRAGVICSLMGTCSAQLKDQSTNCTLKIRSPVQEVLIGNYSNCTIEGINTGRLPPQVSFSAGEKTTEKNPMALLYLRATIY